MTPGEEGAGLKTDPTVLNSQRENRELSLKASLFTVFLTVLFGANAAAVKISFAGVGVFSTAGLRFGFAAVAIFLWAVYTGLSLRISLKQARNLIVISLLFTIQIALFYSGLSKTTASHTTLIVNLLPFIVLILAHYFIPGEPVTGSPSRKTPKKTPDIGIIKTNECTTEVPNSLTRVFQAI